MTSCKIALATFLLATTSIGAIAQMKHDADMDHPAHSAAAKGQPVATAPTVLTEPGQGAFAALSEVVRVLEADPATDWEKVDLAGLRAHLIDMDRLVTDARVSERNVPGGLTALATGDPDTIETLKRMVSAHAAQLARDERWTVVAAVRPDGAELTVTAEDPAMIARIRGLGFFGLMASQDHHREHHLQMARGGNAHAH